VGVLPIVALALLFDAALRAVERSAGGSWTAGMREHAVEAGGA